MHDSLRAAYVFLLDAYSKIYGSGFLKFSEELGRTEGEPSWIWCNDEMELVPELQDEEVSGALLVDPEIAVCLYLLPYTADSDLSAQLNNVMFLASKLEPSWQLPNESIDQRGQWQIALHWLIPEQSRVEWETQVSEIRFNTSHFEEIPIDATISSDSKWKEAFEHRGFSRLLLNTREIIRKRSESDIAEWASADQDVMEAIESLGDYKMEESLAPLAQEIIQYARDLSNEPIIDHNENIEKDPRTLEDLTIQDFRNIGELSIHFRSQTDLIGSTVIVGPNGSGKSNIVEALSLAFSGSSERYLNYLEDGNVTTTKKHEDYYSNYLSPLAGTNAPNITLNDKPIEIDLPDTKERAKKAQELISGTILSQNKASRFICESAADLGAQVAASYSTIADEVLEYIDARYTESRQHQEAVLTKWELSLRIQKSETARSQIANRMLDEVYSPKPQLIQWLKRITQKSIPKPLHLHSINQGWDEVQLLIEKTSKRIGTSPDKNRIVDEVHSLHDKACEIASQTVELLNKVRQNTKDWPLDIANRLRVWGEWIRKEKDIKPIEPQKDKKSTIEALDKLQKKLEDLTRDLAILRQRESHLVSAQNFIFDTWSKKHENLCPTCYTDVSDKGGIISTIQDELNQTMNTIQNLDSEYDKQSKELALLRPKELAESPLTPHEENVCITTMEWLLPDGVSLIDALSSSQSAESIISVVEVIFAGRAIPLPGFHETPSIWEETIERLLAAFKEVESASTLPEDWKQLRSKLGQDLAKVVSNKLPQTIQAVWIELTDNMTPDGWQLPGVIGIEFESRRYQPFARITVVKDKRNPLAAYILNYAETHTLGLAWFLLRYFTFGQFRSTCLVLDDPRQDMDQPAFRNYCRLMRCILRIHSILDKELTLVTLLHHEASALHLTRALDAVLVILDWDREDLRQTKKMKLLGEEFKAPTPEYAFQ